MVSRNGLYLTVRLSFNGDRRGVNVLSQKTIILQNRFVISLSKETEIYIP